MEESQVPADEIMVGFDDDPLPHHATAIEDFPPEVREDVEGLIWLGYLEDEFELLGHSFVIRTLRGDEELLASLVSKEWIDTLGQNRAWAWSQLALALVSVDYDENFCPAAGPDKRAYARARFNYVTSNWYWPVADKLFEKYRQLQERQLEAIQRVEDLSTGSLPISQPFAGSLTDKGDSEPPQEDIREFLDTPDSTDSNSD